MKKSITTLVIILFFLAVAFAFRQAWLPLPGVFLIAKDNLRKADCVVPLLGDSYFRFKKAVELYNKGYAENIVVSYYREDKPELDDYYNFQRIFGLFDVPPKDYILRVFAYFGKDAQNIYFTDAEVSSTYEEALASKELMAKHGYRSLILITSGYHSRRALMIFNSVFKKTDIKIYNYTILRPFFAPQEWWRKEGDCETVIREYVAIVYNFFYHTVLGKKRTAFDT